MTLDSSAPAPRHRRRALRALARLPALAVAVALTGALAPPAPAQPAPASAPASGLRLRIVGGLANVNQFTQHEEPFWAQRLGTLTQGRVQAEIVPFDRAGIRGQNMLRLIELGVVPFGTALLSLTAPDDPLLSAPDLAGISPDMATLRRVVSAFRPQLAQRLKARYGIELLAVYAYPAQVVYCNHAFNRLADLRGYRVRVSSVSQADLMEALGAKPVFTQFAEMLPQMRQGTLDCAITGTMSGHTNGLYQVTTHLHTMALNWGLSVFGANASAWAALPADLRTLLAAELPRLEQAIWDDADRATDEGVACNSGQASGARCATTVPGRMAVVRPLADDAAQLRALVARSVLPRWLGRCGPSCAVAWNQSLAPVVGLQADR